MKYNVKIVMKNSCSQIRFHQKRYEDHVALSDYKRIKKQVRHV